MLRRLQQEAGWAGLAGLGWLALENSNLTAKITKSELYNGFIDSGNRFRLQMPSATKK